jgi:hypothetical protein
MLLSFDYPAFSAVLWLLISDPAQASSVRTCCDISSSCSNGSLDFGYWLRDGE